MKALTRAVLAAGLLASGGALADQAGAQPNPQGQYTGHSCCGGGMMGHPGMGAGMMGHQGMCGGMAAVGSATVENTADGAVIHLTAKDPSQLTQVQQHAQMMANCMGGAAPGPAPAPGQK